MKKILFITSTSLGTNPRLIKSFRFYKEQGWECKVISFNYRNWSDSLGNEIRKRYEIDAIEVDASRENFFPWLMSKIIQKWYCFVSYFLKNSKVQAYASSTRSFLINREIKKLKFNPDLIYGHNLAALYPCFQFSKKKQVPFCFDIEDYHPGETIHKNAKREKFRREYLFKKLLKEASFVSAASPLIQKASEDLIESSIDIVTINNSFYSDEFHFNGLSSNNKTLSCVWFSQNISYGRGLELFIETIKKNNFNVSLTLIGNLDDAFYKEYIEPNLTFIEVVKPMDQLELHNFVSKFDVGLALELASEDYNRDICLTNKIFTYIQAGLYILATNTSAQRFFLEKNREFGILIDQTIEGMKNGMQNVFNDVEKIKRTKKERYNKANAFSFEYEAEKLLNTLTLK